MALDITIKDNYIYIENDVTNIVTDRPVKDVVFSKIYNNSINYTVYWLGEHIDGLENIPFTDFSLDGIPFTNQQVFESWKDEFTSASGGGTSGGSDLSTVEDRLLTIIANQNNLLLAQQSTTTEVQTLINEVDEVDELLNDVKNELIILNTPLTNTDTFGFIGDSDTSLLVGDGSKGYTVTLVYVGGVDFALLDNLLDYGVINGQDIAIGYSLSVEGDVKGGTLVNGVTLEAFGNAVWTYNVLT